MKSLYYSLIGFAAVLLTGCSNELEQPTAPISMFPHSDNHVVAYSDLQKLVEAKNSLSRAGADMQTKITCLKDNKQDTLLYVCEEPNHGWTMYASDTRVPAVIGHSDSGSFTEAMQNEGMALWVESMIEDMKAIRNAEDKDLNFTPSEIKRNKEFWQSISHPELVTNCGSRSLGPFNPISGHYELVSSEDFYEIYDSIPRLTVTNWIQTRPYNNACPYQANGSTERTAAGCGPVAIAQMLYFLHYKIGAPEYAPSEAYCYSHVDDSFYNGDQFNFTSTIWDNMNNGGAYVAPLLAFIGRIMNANYGYPNTTVDFSSFRNTFSNYGINCTECDYNTTILKNSLLEGMPVLVTAHSNSNLTRSAREGSGHAFIIDRYKRYHIITRNYYEWVNDINDPNVLAPNMPPKTEYVTSSPIISEIAMNWGWGYTFQNYWFSLTGDWIHPLDTEHDNWNVQRKMYYNFNSIN